jgi:hypothetical protein
MEANNKAATVIKTAAGQADPPNSAFKISLAQHQLVNYDAQQ